MFQWVGIVYLVSSFSGIQADLFLRHLTIKSSVSETNAYGIAEQQDMSDDASSDLLTIPNGMIQAILTSEHQRKLEIDHAQVHRRKAEEVEGEEEEEVVVVVGEEEEEGDDDDDDGGENDGNGDDVEVDDNGESENESESTLDVPLAENTQQALQQRYNDPPEERDSMGDSIFLPVGSNNIFEQEPPDDIENRTRIVELEETVSQELLGNDYNFVGSHFSCLRLLVLPYSHHIIIKEYEYQTAMTS